MTNQHHIDILNLQVGQTLEDYYLLKSQEDKLTRTNKSYVLITLSDKTGAIQGNLWDTTVSDTNIPSGIVVKVTATVGEYNGKKQLNQLTIEATDGSIDPAHFQESIPEDPQKLINELTSMVQTIKNPVLSSITSHLLNQYWDKFIISPAAKSVHHALKHGLLYHTTCMMRLATMICRLYPTLDQDLMYATITLHDLAKTIELDGIDDINYTMRGTLTGHISLIDQEIAIAAYQLGIPSDNESLILLHHCVLAHHGLLEYGSPVRPRVKEAEIIHIIDNLDATMMQLDTALNKINPGEFTDSLFGMDRRTFYKPSWSK